MAEIKVNDDAFDVEEFFWVLDSIRESGKMNMFGAPKWLEENMMMIILSMIGKCK